MKLLLDFSKRVLGLGLAILGSIMAIKAVGALVEIFLKTL